MAVSEKDVLLRITQATSRISNLNQLLKTSVRISAQAIGVDRCSVWLADDERKFAEVKAVYVKGRSRPVHLGSRISLNKLPKFKRIITEKRIIHSPDISKAITNRFEKEFFTRAKIKSSLSVPLKLRAKVLGALNFGTLKSCRTFTPSEQRLAQLIANQTAIGIENARLYKELADRSAQLQEQSIKVLRESEEKYRTLLENLPQMIFLKDKNSVYVSANRKFCSALGIKPEEFRGKTDFDYFPKKLAQKYRNDDREVIRKGKTKEIIEDYIEKGKRRIVQTVKTPVLGDDGKPFGVLGIFWDITERKQVEEALIRNEKILGERARLLTDLRNLDKIDNILNRVCQAVRDSGLFQRAVMTLNKPGGEIFHLGQVGLPAAVIQRARKAAPLDSKLRARITNKRFRISDSFFVPVEAGLDLSKAGRYIPQKIKKSIDGDWEVGDELFVPLRDFSGKVMGYLSGDTPLDGCRPDIKTIEALETLVEAAASRIREVEAQNAVKQERDFSQSIIDTANSLIICLDHDARITAFNHECERVTGYSREEVLGERWPELFLPPEHRHIELKSFAKWVRAHPRDQYEGPIKTKNGEIRTILWSNTAILGLGKKDLMAIAIGQDITERKRTEEAFMASEHRFRMMAEASPDYIFQTDKQGKTIYCSPSIERILGYTVDERQGKKFLSIVSSSEISMAKTLFRKVISGETIKNLEINLFHKNGRTVPIEVSVVPFFENGEVTGVFGIARDITKRKQVEEALQQSDETARALLNAYVDVALLVKPDGTIISMNDALTKVFGKKRNELLGKCAFDFMPSEVAKYRKANMDKVIRSGKPLRFEDQREGRWLDNCIYPVLNEKGKVVRLAIFSHDITEYKNAEESLRESEKRYRSLFEDSPISLWEEDFSQVKRYIDKLKRKGVKDFRAYFENHPKTIKKYAALVKVLDINRPTLGLFKAKSKEELKRNLLKTFVEESYEAFKEELIAISDGKMVFETEAVNQTLKGEKNNILIRWTVAPGSEQTFSKVLVSIVDITEHKKADEALKESQNFLKEVIDHIPDPIFIKNKKHQWILLNKAICEMLGYPQEEMLGKSDYDFFPKKQAEFFWKKDEEMFKTGKVVDIPEEPITDSKGNIHWLHTKKAPLKNSSGEITTLVGIIRDITDQKKAVEALRKSRDLNTILQISYKITQIHDLNKMLESACEETAKALDVDRCSVSLMDEEEKTGEVKAIYIKNQSHPGILGYGFLLTDFPRVLKLYQRKARFVHIPAVEKALLSEKEKEYFRKEGVISFVVVPLDTGKRLLGILLVGSMEKERIFTESEIAFVQTLANHLAVGIQNVRLMNMVKEQAENVEILSQRVITAQEEERKRIAQQLHDEISQDLALMKINTEITRKNVPAELEQVIQRIKDNENLTVQTLNKVRDLTSYLRPPLLDDLGLVETLRWYIKEFSRRTNIKVTLTSERYRSRLHQDLEMVLYRIAQEALANVAKHAQATSASILLEKKNNSVLLAVKDDGIGFDVKKVLREQKMKRGFGLFSMEERVKLLDGSFKLTSKLKKGTSLEVRLPCPKGR